ncbi:DNA-directed RNA polymerase subunit D [Candidatus Pacearchaeota archaeon]|nr:DNA-directed RNA polymerase subunit D [Candidatus Pacearchaeota archaeon]
MKIIEKKENKIVFITQIEESLSNALRRYLNQIPIIAIDELEISKNDSPLYDETISHRVGLIPIKTKKNVSEKEEIKFKLNSKKEGFVYSEDLGGDEIVYGKIPITTLKKGQELEFVATAKVGKGSEHSKFSPGIMFHRNISEIIMDKEFYKDVREICPNKEIKEKGNKIIILDDQQKEVCDVCEGICERVGKSAETKPTKELIITIESFGQLEVEEIFEKSIEFLKKDLTEISKKLGK